MKKIFMFILSFILFTGCNNTLLNTPTKKVEMFFQNYQSLDKNVISQLNDVINNELTFTDDQRKEYLELMKRHYQSLKYNIKDEVIDGDQAVVTVEVEVMDYSKILNDADEYLKNNKDEFTKDGEYDISLFNDYRLKQLKKANDKVKYTIDLSLSKIDNEWILDEISKETRDKINGIYIY